MKAILGIDVSSVNVKIGLISDNGEVISESITPFSLLEDGDFGKLFDIDDMWNKILSGMKKVLEDSKIDKKDVIAITSDAQRFAIVFMKQNEDGSYKSVYGGPNKDTRGVDAQWIIDDEYEGDVGEADLFKITAHSPALVFGLARLLWFREEDEEIYEQIKKVFMFDDWIQYKLSGVVVSDPAIASESLILNIGQRKWSEEIIKKFEFDPEWFPPLIDAGATTGNLKAEIAAELGLSTDIPIIKAGPDTQMSLIGMGCIEEGDIGIPLGTSTPMMMVMNEGKIDPNMIFWTSCHTIPNKWVMEGNVGNTGMIYDWYREYILEDVSKNSHNIMEKYLSETIPGANSSFAYMGPEKMDFKNMTEIKRSVFVFPSQSTISDIISNKATFARSIIENIAFGILENFKGLQEFATNKEIKRIFVGGGMANLKGIDSIICNVLGQDIMIPKIKETSYLGQLITCLVGLKKFSSYKEAVEKLIPFEKISVDPEISKQYKSVYSKWKQYKEQIDHL